MGFMSRRVIPACICCPALRPSSRQPVKRYKKLLGEIFPKSLDGPANERKITKLCEYAARNPFRIPKIAKFLEQRAYREIRSEHVNYIEIIVEAYSKLLCICKEQMAYFATSILNVIHELLDGKRQDVFRVIGCKTLTAFICGQADTTYAHNIEALVSKACILAREEGEDSCKRCLRAASLECLASMIWFMSTFSHICTDFDEIVLVTLDNYGTEDGHCDDEGEESHHNWVEAVRSDAMVSTGIANESGLRNAYIRHLPIINDSSAMTREESETPRIWARICLKKIVEMAKETTTLRRILDPIFTYFDIKKFWDPQRGLARVILLDVMHFLRDSGMEQAILAPIIRHLDHKNVLHDSQVKSDVIRNAIGLVQQMGSKNAVLDIGVISDLCRHLRKSLQASVELTGLQELNWNTSLQSSIEDCLLEISKGINDAKPLFDMMTITLEELPATVVDARATIGSLLILAYIISSSTDLPYAVFPESLFLHLLKNMMHPEVDVRLGVHRIFSVLLIRSASSKRHEGVHFHPEFICESRRWEPRTSSAFASATALLEKLRKEKDGGNGEKFSNDTHEDSRVRDTIDEEWKPVHQVHKSPPNFHKISCSIIDRNACSSSTSEPELKIATLNDEQIAQLLSAFWIQANQSDNLPSNYEAIAQSFSLAVLSARLRNSNKQNLVRIFQLPLSIKNICRGPDGIPSSSRSLFILSLAMLHFGGKTYNIPELCNVIKSFLSTTEDFQLFAKLQGDVKEFESGIDRRDATSYAQNIRGDDVEVDSQVIPIIAHSLSVLTGIEEENLAGQLFETFTPEDGLLFGPNSFLNWFHNPEVANSDESFSLDEECSTTHSIDGDLSGESPMPAELLHSFSNKSTLPVLPQVIGVGQLLESALHVAGQVASTTISSSPLPYGTLTGHCDSLGMGNRRKLSSWLSSSHDLVTEKQMVSIPFPQNDGLIRKVFGKEYDQKGFPSESWLSLRLPPASPFDNFLKAARY